MTTVRSVLAKILAVIDWALFPPVVRGTSDFRIIRPAAYAGFALLSISLISFSVYEFLSFSLTQDFGAFHQVFHQISHGNLDPRDTIDGLAHYWQVHLELYMWILGPLGFIFRSALFLCIVQDAAGIAACCIAWHWMLTMLYGPAREVPYRLQLALCSLVMLIFNPWIYWAYAFDFHSEPIAVPFLVGSAYAFFRNRTRLGLILAVCVLLTGDVAATYLAGLGVTLLIAARRYISVGLALIVAAIFWLEFSHRIGAGVMSPFNVTYGYLIYGGFPGFDPNLPKLTVVDLLIGLVLHPMNAVYALHDKAVDIYANLSPIGFIGVLSPWALGISFVVFAENQLAYAFTYSQPNFQGIVMYVFGAVGFTWFLCLFARLWRKFALVLAIVAAVNTVGWYAVWTPQLEPHWIRTSPEAARTAALIKHQVGADDQVISSHGLVGRFADRDAVYSMAVSLKALPRETDTVQFVISPYEGINVETVNKSLATLDAIVRDYSATLRMHDANVWWFTVDLNQSISKFKLPSGAYDVPAWACPGPAGTSFVSGPWTGWHAAGSSRPGYVVARAYWRARAGNYEASADLDPQGPANFEVWDATTDELLARTFVPAGPRQRIALRFRHLDRGREPLFRGVWPFLIDPTEAPIADNIDLRVFTYGKGDVNVYRVGLRTLRRS